MRRGMWTFWVAGALLATLGPGCGSEGSQSEVLGGPSTEASVAASCATLGACCATLPSDVVASCRQLAQQAGSVECADELEALAPLARCVPTAVDAGTNDATTQLDATLSSADASGDAAYAAIACTLLTACCTSSSLPADEIATCQSIQGAGVEGPCASLLTDLTAAGSCAGGVAPGEACADLQACCSSQSLPSEDATPCTETAAAGDDSACRSLFVSLTSAGFCGAGAPIPDSGHTVDPDCAMLATCCSEDTFPANVLTTCQGLAGANNGGSCLSAYDSYSALAYCE